MEAIRCSPQGQFALTLMPIHFLQVLGYESAEETVAVRYRACAVKSCAIVCSAIAPTASGFPLRGSCHRR